MTMSNRQLLAVGGVVALCAIGQALWMDASLREIRSEIASARKESQAHLSRIPGEFAKLVSTDAGLLDAAKGAQEFSFKTDADAVAEIAKLVNEPTAEKFAKVIGELDDWLVTPEDEKAVQGRKLMLLPALRELVKAEVSVHLEGALKAPTSADGANELAKARRILVLYPMSDEPAVINEASKLSTRQMQVASRLEGLRIQRYNRWAFVQVELAIKHYNDNVSRWDPRNDNMALLPPLVTALGPIDPALLEPAVLQLYTYAIERTKGSLSEPNKRELVRRLTDPVISRKTLGDI